MLIDGVQSIQHIPIDVQELGADFFVFSGHKIYGPTGLEATVRPSFAFYNTFDEIDVFINAVRRIAEGQAAV